LGQAEAVRGDSEGLQVDNPPAIFRSVPTQCALMANIARHVKADADQIIPTTWGDIDEQCLSGEIVRREETSHGVMPFIAI
jgi:hypothetical protein